MAPRVNVIVAEMHKNADGDILSSHTDTLMTTNGI